MKKLMVLVGVLVLFNSCKEEVKLTFTEFNSVHDDNAVIELNIPKAEGDTKLSMAINSTIESHIANMLNFSEEDSDTLKLDQAIRQFESEFEMFKTDYEENALVWEAVFDGEVIYQSAEVICIAINGYTNTGGAHGNMNITLFNFNAQTAEVLEHDDIISNFEEFTGLVKQYFEDEIKAKDEDMSENYFIDEGFHLPANIGYTDEGILILYNVYEIASYAQGITEFTIPFHEVGSYLKLQ